MIIYQIRVDDQLLSPDFSEIDPFLCNWRGVAGALSLHNFACPTNILHPQSKLSPLELSLSGFTKMYVSLTST